MTGTGRRRRQRSRRPGCCGCHPTRGGLAPGTGKNPNLPRDAAAEALAAVDTYHACHAIGVCCLVASLPSGGGAQAGVGVKPRGRALLHDADAGARNPGAGRPGPHGEGRGQGCTERVLRDPEALQVMVHHFRKGNRLWLLSEWVKGKLAFQKTTAELDLPVLLRQLGGSPLWTVRSTTGTGSRPRTPTPATFATG